MNQDNRRRALAEVASLDAWHVGFTATQKVAAVHVDVVFTDGRIGEEVDAPVTFRMRLRRAEVVVIVPPTEPAKVIKSTVRRDAPTQKVTSITKTSSGGSAEISVGHSLAILRSKLGWGRTKASSVQATEQTQAFRVKQIETGEGEYAWEISGVGELCLDGRPWDAKRLPRLNVRDARPKGSKSLPPQIHVELRCRREDFEIFDIMLKEEEHGRAPPSERLAAQQAAAEAVIRTRLAKAGLLRGTLDDRFSTIALAAIVAEGE